MKNVFVIIEKYLLYNVNQSIKIYIAPLQDTYSEAVHSVHCEAIHGLNIGRC